MPRDHFSKMMSNPYFQTDHYKNESNEALMEARIEKKIASILNKIMFWRGKK
jgi:hypothetical protein